MQQELILQIIIFTVQEGALKVYVPKNRLLSSSPKADRSLDENAVETFQTSLGIQAKDIFFEQLYTFSSPKAGGVTITYYFLIPRHKLHHFQKK